MNLSIKSLFKGGKALQVVEAKQRKAIAKAAIFLVNEIKKEINKKRSPPTSEPNTAPHRFKGKLLQSITWHQSSEKLSAKVGSPLIYARYLELGTTKMASRPFLQPVMHKNKGTVHHIIANGSK